MRFNLRRGFFLFNSLSNYRKKSNKRLWAFLLVLLFIFGGFYLFDHQIQPILIHHAEIEAAQMALKAVNEVIYQELIRDLKYKKLMHLEFNQAGELILLQPDTASINQILVKATVGVRKYLDNCRYKVIKVPLGYTVSLGSFVYYGPQIPIRILSASLVESEIRDYFDQAGINQTRHRILLKIKNSVKIMLPFSQRDIIVKKEVPLVEAVIIGKVPAIYGETGGILPPFSINRNQVK